MTNTSSDGAVFFSYSRPTVPFLKHFPSKKKCLFKNMSFSKYPRFGRGGGGRGVSRRPPPLGSSAIPSLSLNLATVPTTVTTPPTPGPWDDEEEQEEDQDEFDIDAKRKRRRRRASVDDFALAPARLRGDAVAAAAPTEYAFLQDPPPGGGGPRVKKEKNALRPPPLFPPFPKK